MPKISENTPRMSFQQKMGKLGEAAVSNLVGSQAIGNSTETLCDETIDEILSILKTAENVIGGLNPKHEYVAGLNYAHALIKSSYARDCD